MEMHADERKVFRAVAKVHLRTGLPIFTHMPHEGCKKCGMLQLELFESVGVNPRLVCIGHLSDIRDDPKAETQIAIAKRGAFVGFDTVGHTTGALARGDEMARMALSIIEAGYEDHLLLSADGTSQQERKANGGPGYAKVLTIFVPKLRAAGVKEATIHKILVDNGSSPSCPRKRRDARSRRLAARTESCWAIVRRCHSTRCAARHRARWTRILGLRGACNGLPPMCALIETSCASAKCRPEQRALLAGDQTTHARAGGS